MRFVEVGRAEEGRGPRALCEMANNEMTCLSNILINHSKGNMLKNKKHQ